MTTSVVLFGVFIICLILTVPIGIALGVSSIVPLIIVMSITVLLLTFVPQFIMFLPKLFMRGMGFWEALAL